jgi:hypothetical protein
MRGVIDQETLQIEPPPRPSTSLRSDFICGMGRHDERFQIIHVFDCLLRGRVRPGQGIRSGSKRSSESLVLLPGRRGTGVYLLTAFFSILPRDPRAPLVVLHHDGRTPAQSGARLVRITRQESHLPPHLFLSVSQEAD